MKNSLKKVMAIVLSALMVVTTMPLTVFAKAATDTEAAALKVQMDAYEAEMDGTYYTNMLAAYDAYIDANEAYDAYLYGNGTTAQLTSATTALQTAISNMQVWNPSTELVFDATAYHEGNVAHNAYSNVVYCSTTTNWSGSNGYNNSYTSIGSQNVKIAMPTNIVFAYDGVHDIYGPALFEHTRDGRHNTNTKWVGANDSNWEFRDYWYGYYDSNNQSYQMWPGDAKGPGANDSYFGYSQATYQENVTSNISSSRFYWNKLYFKGTPDTTNYYTKTYRQTFHMVGYQDNWGSSGNKEGDIYSDNTQYVINYQPAYNHMTSTDATSLKSKFAALVDSDNTIPVENYKLGGLRNMIAAIDGIISSNPKNYDFSSNVEGTVQTCAADIKAAVALADSATATEDGAGYANLRTAISAATAVYNDGYYAAYGSYWAPFKSAYEDATANMTNLPSNGYSTNDAAQTLADRLTTAYNNLLSNVDVADTTALETAIDDAEYAIANSAYWTATSYANADLQNVVDTAKVAIWTSTAKYKSLMAKMNATDADVAAQLTNVSSAITKLVINKDYAVASAGNYSANSVVAYATDTTNFVPADYANWSTVENAVNAATVFDAAMGNYSDNCAADKIRAYQLVIRNVLTALRNLKDAFSKMENGQLIAQGELADTTEAIGSPDSTGAGQDFKTSFWGYNNSVIFRTSHAAGYLPLPDSYVSIWTQSGYPMGLDSINIDDPSEYSNSNGNGQITSGGNGDNRAVGNDVISSENFSGSLVADNDGFNTYPAKLVLGNVSGRANSGIFVNASRVGAISGNVYASEADGTTHNTAESVSDDNHYTFDLTNVVGTFDNIDNHPSNADLGALGAVWVSNKYTTQMKASTSLQVVKKTDNQLKSTTKLSIDEYSFTNKRFGALLWWKYMNINTFGYTYHGFRHDFNTYSRTVKVVDITDLFRLIDQCENAGYVANEYTTASWNAYTSALAAAKGDMDYSDKTAEWVLEQCQGRYDDLWAAKEGLVKAADRTALIEARDAVKDVYDAGQQGGPWSDESWSAFADYYQNNVVAALNGIYSATGVRDYQYYDSTGSQKSAAQLDIEARAARIVELKDALQSNADFTPLDNAVAALRTKVTDGQFTTASIAACKAALQNVEYFWYTDAQRKAVYASTAADQAIADAAAAVTAAGDLLATVDADVVTGSTDITAAVQDLLADSNKDPDAYDFEAVKAQIAALGATTEGAVVFNNNSYYGDLSTTGYTWQHMSDVNAVVTEALSENYKTYTINITGVADAADMTYEYTIGGQTYTSTGATLSGIPYGTSVRFTAPGGKYVNWYYTYTSATAANAKEKYLSNDRFIDFVVNGDITFRLDNETDTTQAGNVRVTYANSLRNNAYKIEYVQAGATVTLPEAPSIAHYNFVEYTVDGTAYNAGDEITVTKNTMVIANYEYAEENGITIFIANVGGSFDSYLNFDVEYNQKVELTLAGLSTKAKNGSGTYKIDDVEEYFAPKSSNPNKNKLYEGESIYAYTVITGDLVDVSEDGTLFEEYIVARNDDYFEDDKDEYLGYLANAETVLTYGQDYTFYASENMVIIPYTEEQYNAAIADGFINTDYVDENGATAFASKNIINAGTKLSIVSNYVLPDGGELVESGILFTATADGTTPTADLTFKTVGTNGIRRMKSSQHTVGNQFVISPIQIKDSIKNKRINAKYVAYVTYEKDGAQYTVFSKPVNASVIA